MKSSTVTFIWVLALVRLSSLQNATDIQPEDTPAHRLVEKLFSNYNRDLRPVKQPDKTLELIIYPILFRIGNTDEAENTIQFTQGLGMSWTDEFLTWNISEFDGVDHLQIPYLKIWNPDIVLLEMKKLEYALSLEQTYATVEHTGTIIVSLFQIIDAHCDYAVDWFPFDIQNCSIMYGSWSHTKQEINVSPRFAEGGLSFFRTNTEWTMVSFNSSVEVFYDEGVNFTSVYYHIVIARKPMYYIVTLVLPCVAITCLSFIGQFSPSMSSAERVEKFTLGLTTLLTLAVFLLMIADQMPKTSESFPLLGIFMLLQTMECALSTLVAACIMHVHRRGLNQKEIPPWLATFTRVQLTKMRSFFIGNPTDRINKDLAGKDNEAIVILRHNLTVVRHIARMLEEQNMDEELKEQWRRVSDKLDVYCLILFLGLNAAVTIAFLVIGYV